MSRGRRAAGLGLAVPVAAAGARLPELRLARLVLAGIPRFARTEALTEPLNTAADAIAPVLLRALGGRSSGPAEA